MFQSEDVLYALAVVMSTQFCRLHRVVGFVDELAIIISYFFENCSNVRQMANVVSSRQLHGCWCMIIMCRVDQFFLQAKTVGRIAAVRLRHDNSGQDPSWFVDKLSVEDMESMLTYDFPCGQWFATNEGDGAIVRELPVTG